ANPTTPNEHDAVFLERMPFARDVDRHFLAVRQPDAGDLPQRRVRLLGGHGPHLETDPALEGALLQHGRLAELTLLAAPPADELIDCGHRLGLKPAKIRFQRRTAEGIP